MSRTCVGESHRVGAGYAYFCVLAGVFITALYSFRLLYMTFHGKPRYVVDEHKHGHGHDAHENHHGHHEPGHLAHAPHESPWVVTLPLVLLAIPSVVIGFLTIGPMLFGDYFGNAIFVRESNDVIGELGHGLHDSRNGRSGSRWPDLSPPPGSGCSILPSPTRPKAP